MPIKRPSALFVAELLANLALPWALYALVEPLRGELTALLASAAPPLIWSLWELKQTRKLDTLSLFVLAGIALSLVGIALGGNARLLLVRESLLSGLIGLLFLASLVLPKPLIFHLARAAQARRSQSDAERIDALWQHEASRRALKVMNAVWGLGLSGEALLRTWLAWRWPVQRFLAVTPILSYALFGALALWSFWFGRRIARR